MEGQRENNKRIAKNTLMLYVRQILVLFVALYTSRVVLQVLGVADYGIYNVVGGIVSMFGFLSSAMSTAVYRFYSFEMGRDNKERVQKIFCTAINIHVLLAAFIALLAETVGLLLVNRLLQFPPKGLLQLMWFTTARLSRFSLRCCLYPLVPSLLPQSECRPTHGLGS